MHERKYQETMDEISVTNGLDWSEDSQIYLFSRFLSRHPELLHEFETFLQQQAEEEILDDEEDEEE